MSIPIAICTTDESFQGGAWLVLGLVVLAYVGLVVLAVRGAPTEARRRVAGTWLLSAAAVTILARSLDEAGLEPGTIFVIGIGLALGVTLIGVGLRKSERAWPYVVAGSIGGMTPPALAVAVLAWFFATGGCLG